MSNFDPHEEAPFDQMDLLMSAATQHVLSGCNFAQFMENMLSIALHTANDMFADFDDEQRRKCFFWVFVSLWNVAPLPHNQFKPLTVQRPGFKAPCLCGSGDTYEDCCVALEMPEQPPKDLFWPFIARHSSLKKLVAWAKEKAMPLEGAAIVADILAEDDQAATAIKVLDPYLTGAAEDMNKSHSGLLDLYCDLCDERYTTTRKKRDFLTRMVQHQDNVVRSEAWQRLASFYQDTGDAESSRNALAEAMRADPENPSHCLLELVLLVSNHELEQAKQRATFWLHAFRKRKEDFPELVQTLTEAQQNPSAALGAMMMGSRAAGSSSDPLFRITQNFKRHMPNPIPAYTVEYIDADPSDPIMSRAAILHAPSAIEKVEYQWHKVNPLEFERFDQDDIWSADASWIKFLEQNPESMDSVEILSDVMELICNSPYASSPIDTLEVSQLIGERAISTYKQAGLKPNTTMPWLIMENRPLLQALNHLINIYTVKNLHQEAIICAEDYIGLNPFDNHGFRSFLMNYYVEQRMDEKGLALAQQFDDDGLPDTLYGSVLMHYRAGNLKMAKKSLRSAVKKLPKVATYLITKKVKKPSMSEFGIEFGGDDQAWLYRDSMRHVWAATPGCIEWLKKQVESK